MRLESGMRLAADHEHGDVALAGQSVDLAALALPGEGDARLLVLHAEPAQRAGHRAAGTQPVGRSDAAVQGGHGQPSRRGARAAAR